MLARLIEQNGLKNADIARITGYDESTISLIVRGKYNGNAAKLETDIIGKLKEHGFVFKDARLKINPTAYISNENVKRFDKLCDELLDPDSDLTSSFGVAIGRAGRGKTRAAIHYAVNRPDAIYCLFIDGMTLTQVAREISFEFTGLKPRDFMQCIDEISKATRQKRRLVMIDEADKMPKKYIDMLRGVNERCYCPIVLIGEEDLTSKLKEERRLKSRVRQVVEFEPITITDITTYYRVAIGIEVSPDAALSLLKRAEGDFRLLVRDAHTAVRIMNASNIYECTIDVVNSL
jgi:hypothetical protein